MKVIYFRIYAGNWGLMKKTILDEVVFILFLSYSEHRELYSNIGMQHTVGSA
jgi:hypothetical protein